MLSETIVLPKKIVGEENRFIVQLKAQLLKHIKEINRLQKKDGEGDLTDYYTKEETEQKILEFLENNPDIVSFQEYESIYNFPNLGEVGVIYIDSSDNSIYRWDDSDNRYYCIGRDWTQINKIEGGSAGG